MGMLAGFGGDSLVTAEEVDIVFLEQMRAKEEPELENRFVSDCRVF